MPNVEYMAPWFRSDAIVRALAYDTWKTLSPHARRITRHVVLDKGEPVVGGGINHPRRAERVRIRDEQLAAMDPADAESYRLRG